MDFDTIHNVQAFGAKGDRTTDDTAAFQAAIDACHQAGGGCVHVPAGDYLVGAIELRTRLTLHLGNGATLWTSSNPSHYPPRSDEPARLFHARDAHDIAILGQGTIQGLGKDDLGRRLDVPDETWPTFRTGVMLLEDCSSVTIRDITIRHSDSWTLEFRECDKLNIDGVRILNNYYHTNSDGIDPVSCRNVHISNCHIIAGDDCIVLKTRNGRPCEKVVISNCTLESIATAVKIGTESDGDFRDIHVTNCAIGRSINGFGIFVKDGATVERVTVSNLSITGPENRDVIHIGDRGAPIFIDVERRTDATPIGKIRDVSLSDIYIVSDDGILIQGMEQSPVENLSLRNLTVRVESGFDYANRKKSIGGKCNPNDDRITRYARMPSYVTIANVQGLIVDHLRVLIRPDVFEQYPRSALDLHQITDASISDVVRQPGRSKDDGPSVVHTADCTGIRLDGREPKPDESRSPRVNLHPDLPGPTISRIARSSR